MASRPNFWAENKVNFVLATTHLQRARERGRVGADAGEALRGTEVRDFHHAAVPGGAKIVGQVAKEAQIFSFPHS